MTSTTSPATGLPPALQFSSSASAKTNPLHDKSQAELEQLMLNSPHQTLSIADLHEVYIARDRLQNSISIKTIIKWLGDGTTSASQIYLNWWGANCNPTWQYEVPSFLQNLSETQLPHFIAGLRQNRTALVGSWPSDKYVLAALEEAQTGCYATETVRARLQPFQKAIADEFEKNEPPVSPEHFDHKSYATRMQDHLSAKGLVSPEIFAKLLASKFILTPYEATGNTAGYLGHRANDSEALPIREADAKTTEESVRKFIFIQASKGQIFGHQLDDRSPDWLNTWLDDKLKGYCLLGLSKNGQHLNPLVSLKLSEVELQQCQEQTSKATEVVARVQAKLIDNTTKAIFEAIGSAATA